MMIRFYDTMIHTVAGESFEAAVEFCCNCNFGNFGNFGKYRKYLGTGTYQGFKLSSSSTKDGRLGSWYSTLHKDPVSSGRIQESPTAANWPGSCFVPVSGVPL